MSLLSIALTQVQLRPQYHPSYSSLKPKTAAGRPVSVKWMDRKARLHAINLEIGEANLAAIMAVASVSDPKLHKDDARKMMDELVSDKKTVRRVITSPRRQVFYTSRPE